MNTESPDSTPPRPNSRPGLPVGEAQFGLHQRELPIDPTGESVAHERRIDGAVELVVLVGVVADEGRDEVRAVAIALDHRVGHGVDEEQRHLRHGVPLPLVSEAGIVGFEFVDDRRHAAHGSGFARGCTERRDEIVRTRSHDAAHVQRVAHLAVERMPNGEGELLGRGAVGRHHPRPAGAVQAHRHAVLARHGAQLGDRCPAATRDGQRQSLVGEQRPAGSVRGAVDQFDRAGGETGMRPAPAARRA